MRVFTRKPGRQNFGWIFYEGLIYLGGVLAFVIDWKVGLFVALMGGYNLLTLRVPARAQRWMRLLNSGLIALGVALVLANTWRPLGLEKGLMRNFIFVALFIGGIIGAFRMFQHFYHRILGWCLDHKIAVSFPSAVFALNGRYDLAGIRYRFRLVAQAV